MKVGAFLGLLLLMVSTNLMAQNVLMLEKTGTNKKAIYKSGEEIKYKLKGEDHFRQDYIVSIKDSSIVFHYNKFNLEEIAEIDIRKKNFININLKSIGTMMQIAGASYIVIDQFNKTVVRDQQWEFDQDVWITGAVIFAAGTVVKFLHTKKFKVGGRYKLRIININYIY